MMMKSLILLLVTIVTFAFIKTVMAKPAPVIVDGATCRITGFSSTNYFNQQPCNGGVMDDFIKYWHQVKREGRQVRIQGRCASSCTLMIGIIPKERICVAPGAYMAFHQASDSYFHPQYGVQRAYSESGTQLMWDHYKKIKPIKDFLVATGGLKSDLTKLSGRHLQKIFRAC
jgi:hypothetical protein